MPGSIICRQVIIVELVDHPYPIQCAESERYEMTRGTERLLHCLRKEPAGTRLADMRQYHVAGWEEIAAAAERHGVLPLLYHSIKDCLDGLDIPGDVMEQMRRKYYVVAARNVRLYHELHRILELLAGKEIPVIVLKGAYLAERVYGNIALRGMSDVDLLVRQDDLKLIDEILLETGARPVECNRVITGHKHNFGYVLPEGKLTVSINWKLVEADYPCRIDYSGIWSRAQRLQLARTEVLALAPEDLLLYVCLHAAKHTAANMIIRMLCDITEIVDYFAGGLDWPAICVRARQWGVGRAVYVLLRLARELLDAAIPEEQLEALRPVEFEEQRLLVVRRHILDSSAAVEAAKASAPVARLKRITGLDHKAYRILRNIFMPRSKMALKYP
ncbi:MAG: nucleotidyltransferase family protein, partial [Dehalococcoidia bacterium]|nr:nucleotidyltransferase family protein [Dehalococcoidia bacterium]